MMIIQLWVFNFYKVKHSFAKMQSLHCYKLFRKNLMSQKYCNFSKFWQLYNSCELQFFGVKMLIGGS